MTMPFPADTKMSAIPGVAVSWVIPPDPSNEMNVKLSRFSVDKDGDPWFASEKNSLWNRGAAVLIYVDRPFEDYVWLDSGEFLLCTKTAIGCLDTTHKKKKEGSIFPIVPFKSLVDLPEKNCRLYPGLGDNLYVVGVEEDGTNNVYLLQSGNFRKDKIRAKPILIIGEKVTAVAGEGAATFVALGQRILRLQSKKVEPLFVHQQKSIREIALSEEGDLFYVTDSAVGFVGASKAYEFLETPRASIRIRGDALYVYLEASRSVVKIAGLGKFKNARMAPKVGTASAKEVEKSKNPETDSKAEAAPTKEDPSLVYFIGDTGWQVSVPVGFNPIEPGQRGPGGTIAGNDARSRTWESYTQEPVRVKAGQGVVHHAESIRVGVARFDWDPRNLDARPREQCSRVGGSGLAAPVIAGSQYDRTTLSWNCMDRDPNHNALSSINHTYELIIEDPLPRTPAEVKALWLYYESDARSEIPSNVGGFQSKPRTQVDYDVEALIRQRNDRYKPGPKFQSFLQMQKTLKPTGKGLTPVADPRPAVPPGEEGTVRLLR
ncbi:MAG: hypothetical protein HY927_10795 [Elusimicrobia bacterium]|nr:hypothetical protein [Elusimicrobiota bacterium]